MHTMRELSPVITREGMLEALDEGASIVVVCVEPAEKFSNIYKGVWKFYVSSVINGETHRFLYVHGRDVKPREVKTSTGLVSFAKELGMRLTSIPHEAGDEACWERSNPAKSK